MAGLALAGDLTNLLAGSSLVDLRHRLESVKLLPRGGSGGTDPQHHGYLTVQAVTRPEVTVPDRLRVFAMAITARDNRDRGRPSAWSAAPHHHRFMPRIRHLEHAIRLRYGGSVAVHSRKEDGHWHILAIHDSAPRRIRCGPRVPEC